MDRRVRKTLQALEDAFLALENKKPVNQITVAELCALADVGRGTFYLHYHDVAELAATLADQHVQALIAKFAQQPPVMVNGNYRDWLQSLLHDLQSNQAAWRVVLRGDQRGATEAKLTAAFSQQLQGTPYAVRFLVSGAIGVLSGWLDGSVAVTLDALVDQLDQALGGQKGLPNNSIK